MKYIEMTGSPKSANFSTKAAFLTQLRVFGFEQAKMRKKDNKVNILVSHDIFSQSKKMLLASELNVEIMTYEEMTENFDLQGDL